MGLPRKSNLGEVEGEGWGSGRIECWCQPLMRPHSTERSQRKMGGAKMPGKRQCRMEAGKDEGPTPRMLEITGKCLKLFLIEIVTCHL